MKHALTTLALAAAALALGGPARADIQSFARVSNFGYTLIDLNPGDGIAPGIELLAPPALQGATWGAARYHYEDARIHYPYAGVEAEDGFNDEFGLFAPFSLSVGMSKVGATARIAGSVAEHSLEFTSQGYLKNEGSDAGRWLNTSYGGIAEPAAIRGPRQNNFRLAPFTQVVWSGEVFMEARTTVGLAGGASEVGLTRLLLSVGDDAGTGGESLQHDLDIYQREPTHLSYAKSFDLKLSNASAEASMGYLDLTVIAAGFLQAPPDLGASPPIPEPGTWWLMLCGLGAVGAAARSRRAGGSADSAAA